MAKRVGCQVFGSPLCARGDTRGISRRQRAMGRGLGQGPKNSGCRRSGGRRLAGGAGYLLSGGITPGPSASAISRGRRASWPKRKTPRQGHEACRGAAMIAFFAYFPVAGLYRGRV